MALNSGIAARTTCVRIAGQSQSVLTAQEVNTQANKYLVYNILCELLLYLHPPRITPQFFIHIFSHMNAKSLNITFKSIHITNLWTDCELTISAYL